MKSVLKNQMTLNINDEYDETEAMNKERQRLEDLFGREINKHPVILEIKCMIDSGILVLSGEKARPRDFDGLFYVMKRMRLSKVHTIRIEIDENDNFSKNIYSFHGVLYGLILNSNLQELTLSGFKPQVLIAMLATVKPQNNLRWLNLKNNSLTTERITGILRSLSSNVEMSVDLSQNNFDDEELIALELSGNKKIKSLNIIFQKNKKLDPLKIIQNLYDTSLTILDSQRLDIE